MIDRSSPTQLAGTWKKVALYNDRSLFLRHDGTLWATGVNNLGQLGLGDTVARSSPVQIGSGLWTDIAMGTYTNIALSASGNLFVWGGGSNGRLGLGDTVSRSSPVQLSGTWSSAVGGSKFSGGFKF